MDSNVNLMKAFENQEFGSIRIMTPPRNDKTAQIKSAERDLI